jgi:hypothetical protein
MKCTPLLFLEGEGKVSKTITDNQKSFSLYHVPVIGGGTSHGRCGSGEKGWMLLPRHHGSMISQQTGSQPDS